MLANRLSLWEIQEDFVLCHAKHPWSGFPLRNIVKNMRSLRRNWTFKTLTIRTLSHTLPTSLYWMDGRRQMQQNVGSSQHLFGSSNLSCLDVMAWNIAEEMQWRQDMVVSFQKWKDSRQCFPYFYVWQQEMRKSDGITIKTKQELPTGNNCIHSCTWNASGMHRPYFRCACSLNADKGNTCTVPIRELLQRSGHLPRYKANMLKLLLFVRMRDSSSPLRLLQPTSTFSFYVRKQTPEVSSLSAPSS